MADAVPPFAVTATLILTTGFNSGETDSNLYAEMVARISTLPYSQWIAPEWWGFWGRDELFREHPIGIFLLPSLLARLGFPPIAFMTRLRANHEPA